MSSSGSGSGPGKPATPPTALEALLGGEAGDPVRRALWLDALDQRLGACLSPSLAAHARLANVDRDRLVFVVDAPAWHAPLRMVGPALLDAARSLGLEVATLVVRVGRPAPGPAGGTRRAVVPMTAAARRALDAALASLEDRTEGDPGTSTSGSGA